MGPEKSKKLRDRFSFMRSSGDPMRDSLVFGFECGDGWFQTLWDLCLDIEKLDEENIKTIGDDKIAKGILEHGYNVHSLRVTQVKEKMGTLRFYTNGSTDKIWKRIRKAEQQSSITCEQCGKEGSMRKKGGWYSVACDSCQ